MSKLKELLQDDEVIEQLYRVLERSYYSPATRGTLDALGCLMHADRLRRLLAEKGCEVAVLT